MEPGADRDGSAGVGRATPSAARAAKRAGQWDRMAPGYDAQIARVERRFLGWTRPWLLGRVQGRTLEVAVGTGLNLAHYAPGVDLTAVDHSPAMLERSRARARELGVAVRLQRADAGELPFADGSFETVVCTFGMCCVPDERVALGEMARVVAAGGAILLADHVRSSSWWLRGLQTSADLVTVPLQGEHWRRRPAEVLPSLGLEIEATERHTHGAVEAVAARKPREDAGRAGTPPVRGVGSGADDEVVGRVQPGVGLGGRVASRAAELGRDRAESGQLRGEVEIFESEHDSTVSVTPQ